MKEVEWSAFYGEGEVVCTCDYCEDEERFEFENNNPDYRRAQEMLKDIGWVVLKQGERWFDFCCEDCRNRFIKEYL